MVIAGTNSRNTHGMNVKNGFRSACPRSKNPPRLNVSAPCNTRKITMNTDATGVAKYPASSRPATMNTLRMTKPAGQGGGGSSHHLRRQLPEHILQLSGRMPTHELRR